MSIKDYFVRRKRQTVLTILVLAFTVLAMAGWRSDFWSGTDLSTTVFAQQDVMLQRRIDQLEQRFYYFETRLNRLENESRYPGTLPGAPSRNETEVGMLRTQLDMLRTEIDSIRSRLGEVECGLIKLDERTLTPAARQVRRQTAPDSSEPCRADPNMPIRLSVRR
jgi:hypothetical protein